jgi:prepilin-type N-terminal cleavage/methylation domain-containing protein/prepilin-type processing-associated H-X9-DG protein
MTAMNHRCRASRGFTLLELLIVITVIAVLAGMVFAGGRFVMARAQMAASASNLRQWGAALPMYTAEHNGYLPRRGQGVQPLFQLTRPEDWFNALPPYMDLPSYQDLASQGLKPKPGDKSIFICPGAGGQDIKTSAANFLGYGMNMNLSPWNQPNATLLTDIPQPGLVVFMGESPGPYASVYPSSAAYSVIAPHGGKGNLLFLDGHVQNFTADYIGCKKSDPHRDDISWMTSTAADANAPKY